MADTIIETTRTLLRSGLLAEAVSAALVARDKSDAEAGAAVAKEVVDALLKEAGGLERKGDFPAAADALQLGQRIFPQDAALNLRLGRVRQRAGDWQGAIAPLEQAMAHGGPLEAQVLRARSLYRLERFAEAEKAFAAIRAAEPANIEATVTLARLAARRADHAAVEALMCDFVATQPTHVEARIIRARAAAARGDAALAQACYGEAARLQPDQVEARAALARAALDEKRMEEAADHYAALVRLQPERADHRIRLARAYGQTGKRAEALAEWRHVLAAEPDRREAQINVARLLSRLGPPDEALDAWRRLEKDDEKAVEPPLQIARVLSRAGRHAEAIDPLRRLVALDPDHREGLQLLGEALNGAALWPAAVVVWTKLAAIAPEDAAARRGLAQALEGQGNREAALEAVRAGLRASPEDAALLAALLRMSPASARADVAARLRLVAPDVPRRARLVFDEGVEPALIDPEWKNFEALGDSLLSGGRAALAETAFRRALAGEASKEPAVSRLRRKLAQALVRLKRFDEAREAAAGFEAQDFAAVDTQVAILLSNGEGEEAYRAAAAWYLGNKEHDDSKRLMARVSAATKRYQNAASLYRALAEAPAGGRIEDWTALANCCLQTDDYDGAFKAANEIASRDPGNIDALRLRARVLQRRKDPNAMEAWSELLLARPADVEPPLQLARLHHLAGRNALAEDYFAKVLALQPDHVESLRTLSRMATQTDKLDKAKTYWLRWEKAAPDAIEPRLRLARAMEKAGELRAAFDRFSGLLRIDGSHVEALTALARLAKKI